MLKIRIAKKLVRKRTSLMSAECKSHGATTAGKLVSEHVLYFSPQILLPSVTSIFYFSHAPPDSWFVSSQRDIVPAE